MTVEEMDAIASDLQDLCDKQAVEIARQREVIEAWFDVSAKPLATPRAALG